MAPGTTLESYIFFITFEWVHWASVLQYTMVKSPAKDKHFSLLGPFVSYEENEKLRIRHLDPYSQHYIFFVTYEWAK